jgi:ribonuclease-3
MSGIGKTTTSLRGYQVISEEEALSVEKKIFPIYNESNIYVTSQNIQNILRRGGIEEEIGDLGVWQKVFVHESYASSNDELVRNEKFYGILNEEDRVRNPEIMPLQPESSERMEWLGDGILQGVIAHYLYSRFTDQQEGFLTTLRSKMVKTESLSKIALALKFDRFIILSKHIEIVCNGRRNHEILEDAFEAFLGAIMIDLGRGDYKRGFDLCYRFIITIFERYLDITQLILHNDNYKDQLMRYFQRTFRGKLPRYEMKRVINVKNEETGIVTRRFHMVVYNLEGVQIGSGIDKSKREAEQKAAKEGLLHYGATSEFEE